MIITTTQSIEGYTIKEYRGIVFGEVVAGIDFIKDFSAGIRNFFGGRSATYENELIEARSDALNEMEQHALQAGANAVVGVKLDYETLGEGGMMMVIASGTAVVI